MSTIEFGLMLQPFPVHFPGSDLFEYNRGLIRRVSGGFTTLWVEDHAYGYPFPDTRTRLEQLEEAAMIVKVHKASFSRYPRCGSVMIYCG